MFLFLDSIISSNLIDFNTDLSSCSRLVAPPNGSEPEYVNGNVLGGGGGKAQQQQQPQRKPIIGSGARDPFDMSKFLFVFNLHIKHKSSKEASR